MVYGSPPKWNLGHCTWAIEAFVLEPMVPDYRYFNPRYPYLFNSYYNTVGDRVDRNKRGLLSRPTVNEVYQYRHGVDETVTGIFEKNFTGVRNRQEFLDRLELAINHEQQHQELFFTDLKHIFYSSPMQPVYLETDRSWFDSKKGSSGEAARFVEFDEILTEVGFKGEGFCYDNELGRHKVYLNPFAIAERPVLNQEYLEFVEAGGYRDHRWWLSDAWATLQGEGWEHPLYWEKEGNRWFEFTLHGKIPLNPLQPVVHLSFFEADAFARFKGCRLPTEFEWEYVADQTIGTKNDSGVDSPEISPKKTVSYEGHFMDAGFYHPVTLDPVPAGCGNFWGNVWEWTMSSYLPYPGFKTPEGAVAEYNGKFMNAQRVLRGGSCVTPSDHIRLSYRNFFEPFQRWQFSGFRLARDL